MNSKLSIQLKAFATVTIIAPLAMATMSSAVFGGFVPLMALGHPVVLVGLAWVYCSAMVLWRPSSNRLYRLGILAGFFFLSWMLYQKGLRLTCQTDPRLSSDMLLLREVLSCYVLAGAWLLSLILLLQGKRHETKPGVS